jgi:hypothetical protein
MSQNTDWRRINPPAQSMRNYYADMFKRNQMKFMRRSLLEPSHVGSEFTIDGQNYQLIGAGNPTEMVVKNLEDGTFYMVHSDIVTAAILKK